MEKLQISMSKLKNIFAHYILGKSSLTDGVYKTVRI